MLKSIILLILLLITGCTGGPAALERVGTDSEWLEENDMGQFDKKRSGWSASGTLISGDTSKKVHLQCDFPESNSYVVEFSLKLPPGGGGSNKPIQALARIVWSVEGNSVERLVSIADGVSVQGVGQGVRVEIYDNTVSRNATPPNGIEYEVGVQVARGSRGTDGLPPTLVTDDSWFINIGTAARGFPEIDNTNIPNGAGVKSVAITAACFTAGGAYRAIPEGGLNITQAHTTGDRMAQWYYADSNAGKFISLVPGAVAIALQMETTLFNAGDYLIISIIFGIDG